MSNPWINQNGEVVHPNAPTGGGGAGAFASPISLGRGMNLSSWVPHPQSPAARTFVLGRKQKSLILAQASQSPHLEISSGTKDYKLPDLNTLNGSDQWIVKAVPIMENFRGNLPRSFLLGWIQAESGGTWNKVEEGTGETGYLLIPPGDFESLHTNEESIKKSPTSSMKLGIAEVRYCERIMRIDCERLGFNPEGDLRLRLIKLVHTVGAGSFKRLLTKFSESDGGVLSWDSLVTFWRANASHLHNPKLAEASRMIKNVNRVMSEGARLDALLSPAPSAPTP